MGIGAEAFAEFGDDVGVEQLPVHERSTSRGYSRTLAKSAFSPVSEKRVRRRANLEAPLSLASHSRFRGSRTRPRVVVIGTP